jgi:hypothetical protein
MEKKGDTTVKGKAVRVIGCRLIWSAVTIMGIPFEKLILQAQLFTKYLDSFFTFFSYVLIFASEF